MSIERHIVVTEPDLLRLSRLIVSQAAGRNGRECDELETELGRADVVAPREIPADVVTMNSRARFVDEDTGEELEMALVYPRDADVARGRISVLAPVGAALLGLAVGQSIAWPLPHGGTRRLRVSAILYQPEAAGDLHL
jgi:regulator of nucleoside diphosphate kinase